MLRWLIVLVVCAAQATCGQSAEPPVIQVGHGGQLFQAVFSSDGRLLLTAPAGSYAGRATGEAIVWDAKTGEKLRAFSRRENFRVHSASFCLDDTAVALDGRVFDLNSGELLAKSSRTDPGGSQLHAMRCSDDRVVIKQEKFVEVLSMRNGERIQSLSIKDVGADTWFGAAGFDSVGRPVALLMNDSPEVWDVQSRKVVCRLDLGKRLSGDPEFSPDGNWVYFSYWPDSGSSYVDFDIYDAKSGELALSLPRGGMFSGEGLLFLPDGKSCIAGVGGTKLTHWDLRQQRKIQDFEAHETRVLHVGVLADGNTLESRSTDRACRWDIRTGKLLQTFKSPIKIESADYYTRLLLGHGRKQMAVLPDPGGKRFFVGDALFESAKQSSFLVGPDLDQFVPLELPASGQWPVLSTPLSRRQFSPDGKRLVLWYGGSYGVQLRDYPSGKIVQTLANKAVTPSDLIWSADGRRVIYKEGKTRMLWDVENGKLLRTITGAMSVPGRFELAFSPTNEFVYSYGTESACRAWKTDTGEPWRHEAVRQRRRAAGVDPDSFAPRGTTVVSPDRKYAATVFSVPSGERTWRLWDLVRGQVVQGIPSSPGTPQDGFFSSDSARLAVPFVAADRKPSGVSLDIIDLESRKREASLKVPDSAGAGRATGVFLPDNRRVVTHTFGRTLFLLDVESKEVLQTMSDETPATPNVDLHHRFKRLMKDVVVSPDMRYLVAQYATEYTIIWDIRSGKQLRVIDDDSGNISARQRYRFSEDSQRMLCLYCRPFKILTMQSWEEEAVDMRQLRSLTGFVPGPFNPYEERKIPAVDESIIERMGAELKNRQGNVEVTADGRRLILYNRDASVTLWDTESSKRIATCYFLENGSKFVAEKPDGAIVGDKTFVRDWREEIASTK